jgi:hypothetical protein
MAARDGPSGRLSAPRGLVSSTPGEGSCRMRLGGDSWLRWWAGSWSAAVGGIAVPSWCTGDTDDTAMTPEVGMPAHRRGVCSVVHCPPVVTRARGRCDSVGRRWKRLGVLVADTILGVPVKKASQEPTRVLDMVVDLTDQTKALPQRRRRPDKEDAALARGSKPSAKATASPARARKRPDKRTRRAGSTGAVVAATSSAGGRRRAEDRDGIELTTAGLVSAAEALAEAVRAQAVAIADLRAGLEPTRRAVR